ncbi:glycosyltransferase [Streptomyces sp. NPDC001544]|uniref:glycosyltransferase n=1 Tax=Streptomyces sp. NPDC001544 TaxID=3364584 RepID=UPI0036BE7533
MSGFLFVVPPLVGHINPAVGVAAELAARGHRVAWVCADAGLLRRLAGPEAEVLPCAGPAPAARPPELRGPEALKYLWEGYLLPLADAMAPGVRAAARDFRPDVVVADQQAFAGALVAEDLGLPWATSATTSAELTGAYDGMPKVADWLGARLEELRARIGDPAGDTDPRFSPHLLLAFTTPELAGPSAVRGDHIHYVGPSIADRPAAPGFRWERLDPARATVLVTLGTANADAAGRFLTECVAAVRERADRVQAVVADPGGTLQASDDDKDVLVLPYVPQLALLERAGAVVCHAGHNTVCEALWHGVPLVVAPIRDDQPVVAAQVVDAGAGVRVRFGRVSAARLGAALDTVLHEPAHRTAAGRIRAAFRAAGGAPAAAICLERLAAATRPEETR